MDDCMMLYAFPDTSKFRKPKLVSNQVNVVNVLVVRVAEATRAYEFSPESTRYVHLP
jgi:hypothetical protein